jgi:hypothetical protein
MKRLRHSTRRALKHLEHDVDLLFSSITRAETAVRYLVKSRLICRDPNQVELALTVLAQDLDDILGDFDLKVRDAIRGGRRGEVIAAVRRTRRNCHAVLRNAIRAIFEISEETL